MQKRQFIRVLGAGAIGAISISAAGCSSIEPAVQAWNGPAPQGDADPRRAIVSYALLAPNPHNLQSWLVDLRSPGEIGLLCDASRLLPETDPLGRQIMIGQGCFLELLVIAASHFGLSAAVDLFPGGTPGSDLRALSQAPIEVARVKLTSGGSGAAPDPLFAQILKRRSNKLPFDTQRPVEENQLRLLAGTDRSSSLRLGFNGQAELRDQLRELTWQAHLTEVTTPRTLMESIRLMRIGASEINQHRDGISLSGPMIEFGKLAGIVTRESLADPKSSGFAQGLKMYEAITNTAMGHVWIVTRGDQAGNRRVDQLEAGRRYVRLNLQATAMGIAMHPLSQALQEFPEMAPLHTRLRELLRLAPDETVQMLVRVGYGPEAPPKPRRPVETLFRT
jgi:nitroreductase